MLRSWAKLLLAFTAAALPLPAAAEVVVIANRATHAVRFVVADSTGEQAEVVESGELASLRVVGPAELRFSAGGATRRYRLESSSVYFFHGKEAEGPVELEEIGLVEAATPDGSAAVNERQAGEEQGRAHADRPVRVAVKLLVDDDERAVRQRWEERLRKRLDAASRVFARHCGVVFEVVSVETWNSDNAVDDFQQSFQEFHREVSADPARLAIGFTSQYHLAEGRVHLGGADGPLGSHILLREWSRTVSELEKLELLVHELGHHLGAGHSPEPDSVMRPVLADNRVVVRGFGIRFDPLNALAISLVTEEIGQRQSVTLEELAAATRGSLARVYATLAEALPDDPAAPRLLSMVAPPAAQATPRSETAAASPAGAPVAVASPMADRAPADSDGPPPESEAGSQRETKANTLAAATRGVIESIVAEGRRNAGRAAADRLEGDQLTERYIRAAAARAAGQSDEWRHKAFLLGVGIALDTSDLVGKHVAAWNIGRQFESEAQRQTRLESVGSPTMRGRHDLAQHFVVSAAVCVLTGPDWAESLGIAKEWQDSLGESGFSFADLSADLAGIRFAQQIEKGELSLDKLADGFEVAGHLPDPAGLAEGLSRAEFQAAYGSTSDERFHRQLRALRARLAELDSKRSAGRVRNSNAGR